MRHRTIHTVGHGPHTVMFFKGAWQPMGYYLRLFDASLTYHQKKTFTILLPESTWFGTWRLDTRLSHNADLQLIVDYSPDTVGGFSAGGCHAWLAAYNFMLKFRTVSFAGYLRRIPQGILPPVDVKAVYHSDDWLVPYKPTYNLIDQSRVVLTSGRHQFTADDIPYLLY